MDNYVYIKELTSSVFHFTHNHITIKCRNPCSSAQNRQWLVQIVNIVFGGLLPILAIYPPFKSALRESSISISNFRQTIFLTSWNGSLIAEAMIVMGD
jgi:hypothetical protein